MRKIFSSNVRSVKRNWSKLLAMSLIIALGFAFIFGVSITPSKVTDTYDIVLHEKKISDFDVKSTTSDGFDEGVLSSLNEMEGVVYETAAVIDNSSLTASFSFYNVLDSYLVKSLVENGATEEQATKIVNLAKVFLPDKKDFLTLDPSLMGEGNIRLWNLANEKSENLNLFELVGGNWPEEESQILLDSLHHKEGLAIGSNVVLFGKEYTVSGFLSNPLYFVRSMEPDVMNYEALDNIFYLFLPSVETPSLDALIADSALSYIENDISTSFPEEILNSLKDGLSSIRYRLPAASDLFLRFEGTESLSYFGDEYKAMMDARGKELSAVFKDSYRLSLEENYSYAILSNSYKKMNSICYVLPIFFLSVSALVVSISMSRMIEEERGEIATLSSLGIKNARIGMKYVGFACFSCFFGIGLGLLVGYYLVFPIIYDAYQYLFVPPSFIASSINPWLTLVSAAVMTFAILLLTLEQLRETLRPLPAELMLPKTPGEGKPLFIERFPFWKKIPFRFKSTMRNLSRYKKRLWMTALSVGGSTAIVFCGFALLNIVNSLSSNEGGAVARSIIPVSYFLIIFAILLSAIVLYNLTNMSITERGREIATLEVLGYHDDETVFYLYREIGIMAFLGMILGVPLGLGIMQIVVIYLEFGSIADIEWYSYLCPIAVILLFAAVVDLLLLPKIKRIDMISSLKSVD